MFKTLELHINKEINLAGLTRDLEEFGYRHVSAVTEQAEYSRRGGVIDIYPPDFECPLRIELDDVVVASLRAFDPVSGKTLAESHQAVVLLPARGVVRKKITAKGFDLADDVPLDNFVDLAIGDYVVHVNHGVGKFLGIERLEKEDGAKDHFVIKYAESDKLYVPSDQLHLIQKYVAFEHRPPKIYKLGSKLWQRIKKQTEKGVWRFVYDLLEIEAKRAVLKGNAFPEDTEWQKKFEAAFEYPETPGQVQAMQEVKQDMESPRPMNRLLMGDVGYGKTEVAMRAAFKAVTGGKQVVMLVPTTILAEQHYTNFSERVAEFPVRVEMLSRFRAPLQQKAVLKDTRAGTVDIVIGTHRLLSDDVAFKDLGLVIIDEEQRFGVKHKEKLKRLRFSVDVLTLTATPIPRTLYMALTGARDMSIINTPPANRLPVRTLVTDFNDELIRQAITKEVRRKGQVYFVHNHVMSIDKLYKRVKKIVPDARVTVAHGQMSSRALERAILSFINGEIDVLLSTTIIESGMDIPNANTLIVYPASAFGLADLYQLRGRVGRLDKPAYAYFLMEKGHVLTADSQRRLEAIQEHTALGAGFKIALEDLQIRGAGNLLGTEQHGYISAVGFDLYCRLLKGAITQLRAHEGKRIGKAQRA